MVTSVKIDVSLDGRNRSRLESRTYEKNYTDVPNRVLPENLREPLNTVYKALTGEDLPEVGSTFTVRADNSGALKGIYSPCLYTNESGSLIIRWGEVDIPLQITDGKVSQTSDFKGKIKFSFKEELIGKYSKTCLSISVSESGNIVSMPFPVRQVDLDNSVESDVLDALVENSPEKLSEYIQVAGDPSKRGEGGPRLKGDFLKPSDLPIGSYKITAYRKKDTPWGMKYYLQALIDEPFTAEVRKKNASEEWETVTEEIREFAIVKANNRLKQALEADPIITPEEPAVLTVKSHGEFNGFKTASVSLVSQSFTSDPDAFSVDF